MYHLFWYTLYSPLIMWYLYTIFKGYNNHVRLEVTKEEVKGLLYKPEIHMNDVSWRKPIKKECINIFCICHLLLKKSVLERVLHILKFHFEWASNDIMQCINIKAVRSLTPYDGTCDTLWKYSYYLYLLSLLSS